VAATVVTFTQSGVSTAILRRIFVFPIGQFAEDGRRVLGVRCEVNWQPSHLLSSGGNNCGGNRWSQGRHGGFAHARGICPAGHNVDFHIRSIIRSIADAENLVSIEVALLDCRPCWS